MNSTKTCVGLLFGCELIPWLGSLLRQQAQANTWKQAIHGSRHSLGWIVCVGAVIVACSNAQAQNLFATDATSGNIYEFTPDGVRSTFASGLDPQTYGLAFDSAGNLFADDLLGHIYKFTPSGARSTVASRLGVPVGLAFDSAGNLFAAVDSNIYKFTPDGVRSTFVSNISLFPACLAFDSAGNLFVTDHHISGYIYKFTPDGAQSTFASGLEDPWGLAFDSAGNLFATDDHNIYKFTPDGVQSILASDVRAGALAFDSAGNLFATDTHGFWKFTPSGARSGFGSTYPDSPIALAFQVPEPSTCSMLVMGAAALLCGLRRRNR
jgi:sugar lactone lactonase YvrE